MKSILCELIGANNKKVFALVKLKENQTSFHIMEILKNEGFGDFKLIEWREFNDLVLVTQEER